MRDCCHICLEDQSEGYFIPRANGTKRVSKKYRKQ